MLKVLNIFFSSFLFFLFVEENAAQKFNVAINNNAVKKEKFPRFFFKVIMSELHEFYFNPRLSIIYYMRNEKNNENEKIILKCFRLSVFRLPVNYIK